MQSRVGTALKWETNSKEKVPGVRYRIKAGDKVKESMREGKEKQMYGGKEAAREEKCCGVQDEEDEDKKPE